MLDTLELELQELVSIKLMVETELWYSTRAECIDQPLQLNFDVNFYLFKLLYFLLSDISNQVSIDK